MQKKFRQVPSNNLCIRHCNSSISTHFDDVGQKTSAESPLVQPTPYYDFCRENANPEGGLGLFSLDFRVESKVHQPRRFCIVSKNEITSKASKIFNADKRVTMTSYFEVDFRERISAQLQDLQRRFENRQRSQTIFSIFSSRGGKKSREDSLGRFPN